MKFGFVNMKRSCGFCADLQCGFELLWFQACLLSYREHYVPDRNAVKINVLWNILKMYSEVITMYHVTKPVYLKIYCLWKEIAGD